MRLVRTLILAFAVSPCGALAQAYPVKPVHLVVPFPPGGAVDLTARLMQQRLSASLGQPVVIDNRGGAAGRIGAAYVSKAAADGYTMLFTVGSDLSMRQGKVKIIAVMQPSRFEGMPEVPAVNETLAGFDVPVAWYAYFGPPGLPRSLVARWDSEIVKAMESQELRQRLTDASMALTYTGPEQMPALIRTTAEAYEKLLKSTGIKLED